MAKSAKNSITVSIGRKYGGVSSDATNSGGMIIDHIRGRVLDRNQTTFIRENAPVLAERISRRIDTELMLVGRFIAANLIGQRSVGFNTEIDVGDRAFDGEIYLGWRTLAKRTIFRKKRDFGGAGNQFFKSSGALEAEIRQKVGPGLVRLNAGKPKSSSGYTATDGSVTVTLRPLNKGETRERFHIADLKIQLLPGVRTSSITRAVTGVDAESVQQTLERRLGLSSNSLKKLLGPLRKNSGLPIPGFHRPVVQPALQYFLQFRIPRAIERAVQGTRGERRNQSGIGDLR